MIKVCLWYQNCLRNWVAHNFLFCSRGGYLFLEVAYNNYYGIKVSHRRHHWLGEKVFWKQNSSHSVFLQHDSCPVCRLSLSSTQTRGSWSWQVVLLWLWFPNIIIMSTLLISAALQVMKIGLKMRSFKLLVYKIYHVTSESWSVWNICSIVLRGTRLDQSL